MFYRLHPATAKNTGNQNAVQRSAKVARRRQKQGAVYLCIMKTRGWRRTRYDKKCSLWRWQQPYGSHVARCKALATTRAAATTFPWWRMNSRSTKRLIYLPSSNNNSSLWLNLTRAWTTNCHSVGGAHSWALQHRRVSLSPLYICRVSAISSNEDEFVLTLACRVLWYWHAWEPIRPRSWNHRYIEDTEGAKWMTSVSAARPINGRLPPSSSYRLLLLGSCLGLITYLEISMSLAIMGYYGCYWDSRYRLKTTSL